MLQKSFIRFVQFLEISGNKHSDGLIQRIYILPNYLRDCLSQSTIFFVDHKFSAQRVMRKSILYAIVCCQTIFSSNFPSSVLGYCLLSNHFLFKHSFQYPRLLSVVKPFSLQTFLLVSQAIVCCQTIFSSNVSLSILLFTEILFLSQ